ncbi:MAG: flagellin [Fibrobacteres bacterium]|nr:flagellin [Fibrobacterota bacterium]
MRINHNISSMVTQGALSRVNKDLSVSLERLSTGLRINRASDDAAGLSVSEQMRTQVSGMSTAKRNAQDGIALLNIAEGAVNEIEAMLQRMRELAVQSSNDTLTTTERSYTNQEYQALVSEIDRITNVTQYNTQTLLDGQASSFGAAGSGSSILHIGPNGKSADRITLSIQGTSSGALTVGSTSVTSQARAESAILSIDVAINSVNKLRSDLGAYINRLDRAINNLDNQIHNTQSAESTVRDVDFADESSKFTRNQIMTQSATAMLAQANQVPQNVLGLLR